jgi:predicted ribosome quality control (RQC) complex YloA/Tae2 family protein
MYYDALTLSATRDELSGLIPGGRVQRIVQPSDLSLGLEIYAGRRYQLLLSADAREAGVYLLAAKPRRGREAPSPLQLLLLKYVRGARLETIEQPPLERVLRLTFNGEHGLVELICEIMGRYSNIILASQDHLILEAIKRVPPSMNRYRTILPQHPYVPPPAQEKEQPLLLTAGALRTVLANQPEASLWQRIVNGISGISPILAREIAYRATGELEPALPLAQDASDKLLATMDELLHLPQTHTWSPCVAYEGEGEERHPFAYAPYELTHFPDHEPAESISAAINLVLEARRSFDPYKQVRERLHSLIRKQTARQQARLASLRRALVPAAEIERLKLQANAILAMAWSIKPGQRELLVDSSQLGLDGDNLPSTPMHIPLDPLLSASENAQELFRTYRKMRLAGEEVPQLIAQAKMDLAYLAQLDAEVNLAENRPQLDEIEGELRAAGYIPAHGKEVKLTGKGQPLSLRSKGGMLILVGRNSLQNDEVTFRRGAPDDIWLHAHGVPGSHVIIKCGGAVVDEDTLLLGARLAAYYSSARNEPKMQVDYTARRHVRHIKGGRPGMVTYNHEQTLMVVPEIDELESQGD